MIVDAAPVEEDSAPTRPADQTRAAHNRTPIDLTVPEIRRLIGTLFVPPTRTPSPRCCMPSLPGTSFAFRGAAVRLRELQVAWNLSCELD